MDRFINTAILSTISVNEILPVSITIKDLPDFDSHALEELTRFDSHDAEEAGTSILAHRTISIPVLTISNLWNDGEIPAAGKYRVRVIVKSEDAARRIEVNAMISILSG